MLPVLLNWDGLTIFAYPVFLGIAWGVAWQVFRQLFPGSVLRARLLFAGSFLSAWIGAKLLFLLSAPALPGVSFQSVSFWTGGGFVFYGGLILTALFVLSYHFLIARLSTDEWWAFVPALCLGHGIGRIGCFLAGCCYGKPTSLFWGVFMHGEHRHPTQLLEALGLLFLAWLFYRRSSHLRTPALYLILYGLLRLSVETLRGDDIRGFWGVLSTSQWVALAFLVIGVFLYSFRYLRDLQAK